MDLQTKQYNLFLPQKIRVGFGLVSSRDRATEEEVHRDLQDKVSDNIKIQPDGHMPVTLALSEESLFKMLNMLGYF